MRRIERTNTFKRDYKRVKATPKHRDIDLRLSLLAADIPLPRDLYDHPLTGDWKDHRDCHIKPDLLLIYRKPIPECCNWFALVRTTSSGFNVKVGLHFWRAAGWSHRMEKKWR